MRKSAKTGILLAILVVPVLVLFLGYLSEEQYAVPPYFPQEESAVSAEFFNECPEAPLKNGKFLLVNFPTYSTDRTTAVQTYRVAQKLRNDLFHWVSFCNPGCELPEIKKYRQKIRTSWSLCRLESGDSSAFRPKAEALRLEDGFEQEKEIEPDAPLRNLTVLLRPDGTILGYFDINRESEGDRLIQTLSVIQNNH